MAPTVSTHAGWEDQMGHMIRNELMRKYEEAAQRASLERLTRAKLKRHYERVARHVVLQVRQRHPSLEGIFVHGSVARGEPGPYSDMDLVVVSNRRKPSEYSYFDDDVYVGVGFQSISDLEKEFTNPKTFFWARGSASSARILYDPKRVLRKSFARWREREPSRKLLEKTLWDTYHNLIEYSGKLKNAWIKGDEYIVRHAAWIIGHYAESAVIALNNISVISENYVWSQVLHAKRKPSHLNVDYPLTTGIKGTSDTPRVYRAALRLCKETMLQIRKVLGENAKHKQFRALLTIPIETYGL